MLQQVAKQCVCACQQWLLAFGILYGQASKLIKKKCPPILSMYVPCLDHEAVDVALVIFKKY